MFSHRAEEQFVVLIPLGGSCRHCENSSVSRVTLPAVRGEAKPAAGQEGGSRKGSNPCWEPFPLLPLPFPLLPFPCLGTAHRGKGELFLSPGMLQDPAGAGSGECKGERPREDGCHKSKDLRTQGTWLFRLKCVCEALQDSGCKGGGDLAAALLSLLGGIFP